MTDRIYYNYEDIQQQRIALEAIKDYIEKFESVLDQKHYFEYLKFFYVSLSKDLPKEKINVD